MIMLKDKCMKKLLEVTYMIKKTIVYLIYELHNGVRPRLRTGYLDKKSAYRKVEEWNNREKKWESEHRYYVKEFEVYE